MSEKYVRRRRYSIRHVLAVAKHRCRHISNDSTPTCEGIGIFRADMALPLREIPVAFAGTQDETVSLSVVVPLWMYPARRPAIQDQAQIEEACDNCRTLRWVMKNCCALSRGVCTTQHSRPGLYFTHLVLSLEMTVMGISSNATVAYIQYQSSDASSEHS